MSTNTSPVTGPMPTGAGGPNIFDTLAQNGSFSPTAGVGGTTGTSTGVLPPGTAGSAYQYENYLAGAQVQLGQNMASILGLQPGTYQAGQVIQAMDDLPQAQLVMLEEQLQQGGFYTDASGAPLQSGMTFGTQGNALSFQAMANAIIAAGNARTSLDQIIAQGIGSGAGQRAQQSLPQGVIGGGNVYQIDLANPQDVAYSANQVFQAALGRNATPSEVSRITAALQAQEKQQGYAREAAGEAQSRAHYQAEVNLNNSNYQYETTPKVALGNVPAGPFNTPSQWASALLQYLQLPDTASNVAALSGWAQKEGGNWGNSARFNPLNTTLELPGSQVMAGGNSAGVQAYTSWAQGLQATADTLTQYPNIMAALASGDATNQMNNSRVSAELQRWSGGGYSTISTDAKAAMPEAQQTVDALNAPANPTPATAQASAFQTSMGVLGAGMPAGTAVGGGATGAPSPTGPGVAPQDIAGGQQISNPADQYIPAVTDITVNPASAGAAAYNAATTGPNRIPYAANTYLNAYNAILSMIKAGGPTGG